MNDVTDSEVIRTMELFGGGFASHLATACRYADSQNLPRIKEAFADLWATYLAIAKRNKARETAA